VSSVGSFFSYVNDARSHETEDTFECLERQTLMKVTSRNRSKWI